MSMTIMQLEQAIERAEREGRQAEAEQLRFLLAEVTGEGPAGPTQGQTYTVQEGDDVFGISETYLGSLEYVPDFLAANPESGFTVGEEVVLPPVGGDANDQEDQLSVQLVELFETKGPPNDSWTAEDYALLEAVQAAYGESVEKKKEERKDDPVKTDDEDGGIDDGQNGQNARVNEEEGVIGDRALAANTALIDLPAEDAEIIAQFMAQMIMNGVVPDGSAWGPGSVEEEGRKERERDLGPDGPEHVVDNGGEYSSWEDRQRAEQQAYLAADHAGFKDFHSPVFEDRNGQLGVLDLETGVWIPVIEGSLESEQRQQALADYVTFLRESGQSSANTLMQAANYAAALNREDIDGFMEDMSLVLGHVPPGALFLRDGELFQITEYGPYYTQGLNDSSGFRQEFIDPDPKDDQVEHMWYFVEVSYYHSAPIAFAGNIYHEKLSDNSGQSQQDYELSNVGIELGFLLRTGELAPNAVGAWLGERVVAEGDH